MEEIESVLTFPSPLESMALLSIIPDKYQQTPPRVPIWVIWIIQNMK